MTLLGVGHATPAECNAPVGALQVHNESIIQDKIVVIQVFDIDPQQ